MPLGRRAGSMYHPTPCESRTRRPQQPSKVRPRAVLIGLPKRSKHLELEFDPRVVRSREPPTIRVLYSFPFAAPGPTAETLVWSASDIPETVDIAETVQPVPFFLSPHHRVLLGSPSEALRVAVTALHNIDADVSMTRPVAGSRELEVSVAPSASAARRKARQGDRSSRALLP